MEMRRLGATGTYVSSLCLGAMTFGTESSEEESLRMLDHFVDAGGNFVDTANTYGDGRSEEILGRAFASSPALRDRIVLATKFSRPTGPGPNDLGASRRHIHQAVEASLRRLGTDWIDLYQVHAFDVGAPIPEMLSTLDDLVRAGKVRYLGVSSMAGWQVATALGLSAQHGWEPFVCMQPQYSLLARGAERELFPLAQATGLGIITWSPLAGGVLSGKYRSGAGVEGTRAADKTPQSHIVHMHSGDPAKDAIVDAVVGVAARVARPASEVALNWVLHRPGVTAPIIGARTVDQLTANLEASRWQLDPDERALLDEVSAIRLGDPYESIAGFAQLRLGRVGASA